MVYDRPNVKLLPDDSSNSVILCISSLLNCLSVSFSVSLSAGNLCYGSNSLTSEVHISNKNSSEASVFGIDDILIKNDIKSVWHRVNCLV